MRIYEIASADDQIALFKLITDKVWQALGDQQRAEAETKAAQPLKAKLKPISPKKPKPPAARTVPKPTVKVAPSAKVQPQPARTQPFVQQSPNIQSPSAKQKQNSNRDKDPQSADFDEFSSQQVKAARGKDIHS
jgi:outer membrane biosynthesis protein TonB